MEWEYLPEFAGTYLEDSYFLGVTAEGPDLRLKVLFALTVDRADYTPPIADEQHCYREGWIVLGRPTVIEATAGRPNVLVDPDGSLDFGSIELYRQPPTRFRVVTEWFAAIIESDQVSIELAD